MKTKGQRFVRGAVLLVAAQAMAWAAPQVPVAVSPGGPSQAQEILTKCPTFSWATVDGARGYELAVRPARSTAPEGKRAMARTRGARVLPVLDVAVQGSASSWTPSAQQCLQEGVTYEWRVREVDESGFGIGDWSEAKYFLVAGQAPAVADDPSAGRGTGIEGAGKGNGTGGIPAVLDTLAELQDQLQANDDLLNQRLDALQARIDAVDMRVEAHDESQQPCTPERWLRDKCAHNSHPLDLSSTFCFNVNLGANLGLELALEPGVSLALGGSWKDGPDLEAQLDLELPFVAGGPVPVVLPDAKLGVGAGGGATLQLCFNGLTFPVGDLVAGQAAGPAALASAQDVDQFTQTLVDAIQAKAPEIYEATMGFVSDRGLSPDKVPAMFDRLKDLRSPKAEVSDPIDIVKSGRFRDFLDTLPLDGEIRSFLDDPSQVVPTFDPSDPFAACESLNNIQLGGRSPGAVCSFVDDSMPDLAEVAENIKNFPSNIVNRMCDEIPGLNCGSNVVSCRLNCAAQKTQCVNACGLFQFRCRRQCEAQRVACVNGC